MPCPIAGRVAAKVEDAEALAADTLRISERQGSSVEALRCSRGSQQAVPIDVLQCVDDPSRSGHLVKGSFFAFDSAKRDVRSSELEDARLARISRIWA